MKHNRYFLPWAFFWIFNRIFMVPAFRLGLGPLIGNPITGYIMVLRTIGRKTGKVRYTPLNYSIMDGFVYCIRGSHLRGQWFHNLMAHPEVEIILPSGTRAGIAQKVTDPQESVRAIRQTMKNGGFAAFIYGFNPFTAQDDVVREKTKAVTAIRIISEGIERGPGDAGGRLWILVWGFAFMVVLLFVL
jgi:deazaflavin-dependent oxidoreductase (nitroreductase family)